MKIVAKYDFNGGRQAVEQKYALELTQIETVINAIDSSLYKTKQSTEKTMMGKMLFAPLEINKAFKAEFNKIGWQNYKVNCDYVYGDYLPEYQASKSSKEYRKRNASGAVYDDPRVAVGPGVLSESER